MPQASKSKSAAKKGAKKSGTRGARKRSDKRRPRDKSKPRASRAALPAERGAKGRKIQFLNLGRPSVINVEVIESICNFIAEGLSFENSCIAAGIADSTGRDWMRRARLANIRMDEERKRIAEEQKVEPFDVEVAPFESERIYLEFSAAVKRAQVYFQTENLRIVRSGVERWQANAWLLERRAPDEYALQRGGKDAPAPQPAKGNQPIDRVVGRYTEFYIGGENVPLPTPEQIKAAQGISKTEDDDD